jgi:hypothetical protein
MIYPAHLSHIPTNQHSPTSTTSTPFNTPLQISTNQIIQSPLGPPVPPLHCVPPIPPPHHHPHMGPLLPPNGAAHPPHIIWYYPTPPVSPSSTLFFPPPPPQIPIHSSYAVPCVLIVKGAPASITINEILQFFTGYDVIFSSFFYFL